jgi:hypothetical protein
MAKRPRKAERLAAMTELRVAYARAELGWHAAVQLEDGRWALGKVVKAAKTGRIMQLHLGTGQLLKLRMESVTRVVRPGDAPEGRVEEVWREARFHSRWEDIRDLMTGDRT